ncbi:CbtA family protein [Actinoplanes bogorensis]|uniref:CbtA family protein n=1 Tax=Paractinoplanes bogorensis TaxID=1610840 RepID=A0ABS5YQ06_9ACTN|nr:CbtA family protein [Actinoplanes bogorensis]MBU2665453.1 CbtA family protein [Actinoplanes bogorensis]
MPLSAGSKAPATFGALLLRGLLAGLIAGLLAGTFAFFFGEPKVDAAISIEEAASAAQAAAEPQTSAAEEEPLVSRDGQKGGLFLATGLYGIALGGILATAYTLLRRRLRTPSDTRAALGLAGAALLGVVLVPYVKYPPNPPAVGDPDTINQRTISYLAILVIGLVAVWAAVVAQRTQPTEWRRAAAAVVGFLVVVVVGYALLPNINEVPATFPPDLLWSFRLASLGTQTVMWTVLGIGFAALVSTGSREPAREAVPA